MSANDYTALRKLLADATPAPWRVDFASTDGTHEISHEDILVAYSSGTRANAELIAALRNDAPGLLDELDKVRAENTRRRDHLAELVGAALANENQLTEQVQRLSRELAEAQAIVAAARAWVGRVHDPVNLWGDQIDEVLIDAVKALDAAAPANTAPHCGLCGSEDCPGVPGTGCMPGPFEDVAIAGAPEDERWTLVVACPACKAPQGVWCRGDLPPGGFHPERRGKAVSQGYGLGAVAVSGPAAPADTADAPDWVTVLDDAIATSGVQLVFDPRNWTAPHIVHGTKATDPDREHPAHVGQTCDEYEAAAATNDAAPVYTHDQMRTALTRLGEAVVAEAVGVIAGDSEGRTATPSPAVPGAGVDRLIARSSLGTPEATTLRAAADEATAARIVARAEQLAAPGADEQTASVWVDGIHHAASRWGGQHCQACGKPWPCPVAVPHPFAPGPIVGVCATCGTHVDEGFHAAPVAGTADKQSAGGEDA